jgi:hypothetical protein
MFRMVEQQSGLATETSPVIVIGTGAESIVIALTVNFPGQAAARNACGLLIPG